MGIIYLFKELIGHLFLVLKSRNKWLLVLFFLWLYRVDFMPDSGVGFAKILQVLSIFGILLIVYNKKPKFIPSIISISKPQIKSLIWLYVYAVISTLWAFSPSFAFFLSFQNLVMIIFLFYIFIQCKTFENMEKLLLVGGTGIVLFEAVTVRIIGGFTPFVHFLPSASSSALLLTYSIAELLSKKLQYKNRNKLLLGVIIINLIILITSTSSGANASAFAGFGIALLLSGNVLLAILCIASALFIYLNPDLMNQIILFIMPGKTMESIETATGRTVMWELILEKAAERPLLGWGYACAERSIGNSFIGVVSSDAHNNFIGIYGSLGIVGLLMFIIHWFKQIINALKNRFKIGMLGILCATCCALLNSYSYGFLSGKACSITIIYFSIVILSFLYLQNAKTINK